MKDFDIKIEELQSWLIEKEVTYASHVGKGINKKLNCDLRGRFIVYNKESIVLITMDANNAVNKFNSIKRSD